jgi:hypothetical protein
MGLRKTWRCKGRVRDRVSKRETLRAITACPAHERTAAAHQTAISFSMRDAGALFGFLTSSAVRGPPASHAMCARRCCTLARLASAGACAGAARAPFIHPAASAGWGTFSSNPTLVCHDQR